MALPNKAEGILVDKVEAVCREWIPKILLDLQIADSISKITDPNDQLNEILKQFKLSSDETKNIFYHGLMSLILEKLSDGKLSWSDSVIIGEYYYQNYTKK